MALAVPAFDLTWREDEKSMKRWNARIAMIVVLVLANLPVLANAAGLEAVRQYGGGQEYRLANGLKIVLFPDDAKPSVAVNITYLVGSRHEGYGERGMAHMLEHMMFKGSSGHPDIPAELSQHGGQANGTTWYDRTNYYEVLPEGEEHLAWALSLEADRMVNSAIRSEDLAKEMTVVRNEWEAGENQPARILRQRIHSTAYLWHNYGQDTIGARSDLENVSTERLRAFYRNYYQPDNAVLVVAGKFRTETALRLIEKYFGPIERPERKLEETYTVEPAQDGERHAVLRRVGDVPMSALAYHIPAAAHPDTAALSVLAEMLDSRPTGILYKELVQSGLAAGVQAGAARLHDPGLFEIYLSGGTDQAMLRRKVQAALDGLAKQAPSGNDVNRAKRTLDNEFASLLRSPEGLGISLSESIGSGDWRLFFLQREQLAAVTAQDVQRVAAHYLVVDNRTSGEFQPTRTPVKVEIPPVTDMTARLAELKDAAPMAAGETIDPAADALQQRVRSATADGIRLSVLKKMTKDDIVNLSLTLHLGDAVSLRGQGETGVALGKMLMRGTKLHSEQEIKDQLAAWRAELAIQGGRESVSVELQVPRSNFPAALQLVAEILRQPRIDGQEWVNQRRQWIAQLESKRNDPQTLAFQALRKKNAPSDAQAVRYPLTVEETIAAVNAVNPQQLAEFHKRFYGASAVEAGVVGNVTLEEIQGMLKQALANWPSAAQPKPIVEPYHPVAPETVRITTPDKENAVLVGGQPWRLKRSDPDYPALLVGNEILGGGFLNSRLAVRVRQQDGLSYSIGSRVRAGNLDDSGSFLLYAICAPQNIERLKNAVREELLRIVNDGVSDSEVAEARTGLLKALRLQRTQDAALAGMMADQLYVGRSFTDTAVLEQKLETVSAAEVSAALQRYLKIDQLLLVEAGDWRK